MKYVQSKITGRWSVMFRTKHGRRSINTKQTDLKKAEQFVKDARLEQAEYAALIEIATNTAAMNVIFGRVIDAKEAFALWEEHVKAIRSATTAERYRWVVHAFLALMLWPKSLARVQATHIDQWINDTSKVQHASTRKVNRAALFSFFKFCANEGWCNNPVANVVVKLNLLPHALKEPKRRRPFTPEEFSRLIDVAKIEPMPYWHGALMIARYTGLRWGDVNNLEIDSIQSDRLIVWTDKRDKRVELPMPPELPPIFDMLAKHKWNQPNKNSKPGAVFQQRPAEAWGDACYDFRRLAELANLPRELTLHCLRHTYAVETSKSGLPLKEIAKRMGHFSDSTTLEYLRTLLQ
jgi:integrase